MSDDIIIETREGKVLEITLNRPDNGNVLTPEMAEAMGDALDAIGNEVRVVLLRANGNDFCTGRSAVMPGKGARATAQDLRGIVADPVLKSYAAIRAARAPVVCAVRGRADGVGCAMAALADVCIAARGATFCVPEMNRDIPPTLVMDALVDRVSRVTLARLVLTRDEISAEEAKAVGLIGKVVEDAGLDEEVDAVVGRLAANPAIVTQSVKTFLVRAPEASYATRRELASLLNSVAMAERFR